jgi:hypothetical protein
MRRGDLVTVAAPGDFGKPRPALVIQSDRFRRIGDGHRSSALKLVGRCAADQAYGQSDSGERSSKAIADHGGQGDDRKARTDRNSVWPRR